MLDDCITYQKLKSNMWQPLRFVGSGVCAAVVHTTVMYGLIFYSFNPHVAFFLGFVSGVVFRFFIDRNFVFLQKDGVVSQQFLRYMIACMITYGISESLFFIFLEIMYLNQFMSFVLAVILTAVCGYKLLAYSLNLSRNNVK